MKKEFLKMNTIKKRALLAWIVYLILLLPLAACGKDANSIIPGTWTGDWDYSYDEETTFYDDGTIEHYSDRWSIVNGNILKIGDIANSYEYKYTIDSISNKRMTLRDESGSTITLSRK